MCDSCARRCWLWPSTNRRGAEGEKAEQAGGTGQGNIHGWDKAPFFLVLFLSLHQSQTPEVRFVEVKLLTKPST